MRVAALVLLLAACAADGSDRWAGTVETLPNGAVRVTNPAQGLWGEGDGWRLVPELAVGDVDGPEATTFGAITGLAVDGDGRIYVLDRQANELRIFTRDGAHVRTVGRSGAGPGEYSNANGLLWLAPDTLVVVDQRGGRYSILTREGEYVRSVRRRLGFFGWAFRGGYDAGVLYEQSSVGGENDARPVLLGTALAGAEAAAEGEVALPESASTAAREPSVDTLFLPRPAGPLYESFSVRTERAGMVMGVPFAPEPVYHLDGRGGIWFGHGSEFRVFKTTFAGDTLLEIVLDATPAPVTAAELAEWEAQPFVARFREIGGRIDMDRIPKVKPFFDALYVDPDGYLWVSVPAGPMEMAFALFDGDGRYLGRLQVDGLRRDVYLEPVVRGGRLHVVGRDELDVQRVYVFGIER